MPYTGPYLYYQLQISNIVLVHLIFNVCYKLHTTSLLYTSRLITVTSAIWNRAQPWMARKLAWLEIDLTNVDIYSGYATCSQLRNKSLILDVGGENSSPSTPATNNTNIDEVATFSNLLSLPRDTLEMITLSDASQNSFHRLLWWSSSGWCCHLHRQCFIAIQWAKKACIQNF